MNQELLQRYKNPVIVKKVQIDIIKAQLELIRNFYYGEDLKDEDVLQFYIDLLKIVKKELKADLKKLEDDTEL